MVHVLRCLPMVEPTFARRVVGKVAVVLLLGLAPVTAVPAEEPGMHHLYQGTMPPGAIGGLQLQRREPLYGFFQPVQIKAPAGALISLAEEGSFGEPEAAPVWVGMAIGPVYRLRVMNIPLRPGMEVFPTIEVIDRLYAPRGHELQFPIQVELSLEDLTLALDGKFVTRVIYLEDPQRALPVAEDLQTQQWIEAGPGRDPLAMADQLGRPVAILRMGGRVPVDQAAPDMQFLYGCPPLVKYPPRTNGQAPGVENRP